jgi:hypothetical protein
VPPPEGTKFKFKTVIRLKDELHFLRDGIAGELLSGSRYEEVLTRACRCLELKDDPPWEALMRTAAPFYGLEYTEAQHEDLTWRLAAGREWLMAGIHIEPRFVAAPPYWAPILVEDCQYLPKFRDRDDRVRVHMRLLGGRFSGHALAQSWSHKYHTRFVAKEIGFPVYEPVNYRELAQMWLAGLLDTSNPKRPLVVEIFGPSGAVAHNRKLRAAREKRCLWGHDWKCYQCHLGYFGAGGCRSATHLHTFTKQPCPRCKRTEAWFDPGSSFKFCVTCLANDRRRARMGG